GPPPHYRSTGSPVPGYLVQSAMFHISESHGVGSTPLRLFDTPGREGAVDERDDHYIADEDVVRLDRKVVPLLLIRLLAERVDDRVEVRVGVAVVVAELPVVGLARHLLRRP